MSQSYQTQINAETKRIEVLDQQQRQVSFEDLTQTAWVGDVDQPTESVV
ncbi:MAG: hypothetical protein SFY66_12680 [Oculatellaceae cyanobacterium bins.114]|nr:hypothetical protein [Oculatellaceae cyanobacterium bins.114]